MQSPLTDKHVGIRTNQWGLGDSCFSEIRHKAQNEIVERRKKAKRSKQVKVPCYEVGDRVVIVSGAWKKVRHYDYVEVIDFAERDRFDGFFYYGILLNTTSLERVSRIGRIVRFAEQKSGIWDSVGIPANVPYESVIWKKELTNAK